MDSLRGELYSWVFDWEGTTCPTWEFIEKVLESALGALTSYNQHDYGDTLMRVGSEPEFVRVKVFGLEEKLSFSWSILVGVWILFGN